MAFSSCTREETAESGVGQQAAYLRGQISEHVKSAKEAEAELAEVLKTLRSLRRVGEPEDPEEAKLEAELVGILETNRYRMERIVQFLSSSSNNNLEPPSKVS
ncbi:uncharacterized protein LOC111900370 isoform X4 [Lactuca sativa]|uniref:Uncharacterized protein n=1 Tax=Lactuca sativa TaxID=4236 RepID=A0A9R1VAI0_LACSA|nr:uncharacterized protein LOC111900370 isoform X4 [Lactuca sativa]KAJ0201206.1 hypothetical protein LSAT_V11C600301120 [Lactuca sativa]